MQLPAFEGFQKVSLLGKVSQAEPHAPRPGDPEAAQKEKARQRREVFVVQGQALFAKAVTDVHILRKTFRFKDDVLPRFLTHMRNGAELPDDLWSALLARAPRVASDVCVHGPITASGENAGKGGIDSSYEIATQWESVSRLMQDRAMRDAARAGKLVLYAQAIDTPQDTILEAADYKRALEKVNYNSAGGRMGLCPRYVGMRLRLTCKLSAKLRLVQESVGVIVGIDFNDHEFTSAANDFRKPTELGSLVAGCCHACRKLSM